jgi:hypothetical protein
MTLYSVDGRDSLSPEDRARASELFHGFPVLGKSPIADARQRTRLLDALRDGVARSDGALAKCFWPRHGLRVVGEGGETVDFVICFQCLQLAEWRGEAASTIATTRGPQPVFDKALTDAGLPLAPDGG